MKSKNVYFAFIILSILVCSCKYSSKSKTTASNGKDTITVHRKAKIAAKTPEKNKVSLPTEVKTKVEKKDTPTPNTSVVKEKIEKEAIFVPLPPEVVSNSFNSSYATATNINWSKEIPLPKVEDKELRDYKVYFVFLEMNNSAIYAQNGDLIEIRMQILPVQLPGIVHEAIKLKYPAFIIVTAYSLKNSKLKGAYVANIISPNATDAKELILTDSGVFVE
jgi:hypothetical protein